VKITLGDIIEQAKVQNTHNTKKAEHLLFLLALLSTKQATEHKNKLIYTYFVCLERKVILTLKKINILQLRQISKCESQ